MPDMSRHKKSRGTPTVTTKSPRPVSDVSKNSRGPVLGPRLARQRSAKAISLGGAGFLRLLLRRGQNAHLLHRL